jgi:hypothetical protein
MDIMLIDGRLSNLVVVNVTGTDVLLFVTDVSLDMPDILDITSLRGLGKQPDEEELPERQATAGLYVVLAITMYAAVCLFVMSLYRHSANFYAFQYE